MNTATPQAPNWQARPSPYGNNLMMGRNNFPTPGSAGETSTFGGTSNRGHVDPESRLQQPSFPQGMNPSLQFPQEGGHPVGPHMLAEMQAQMMVRPIDPYFIGDGTSSFYEFIYPFCDWTFALMAVLFLASIAGLGIVVGGNGPDNIFQAVNASSIAELDERIAAMTITEGGLNVTEGETENETVCTTTAVFGSFGDVCLEESINSYVFVMLLSHLNVGRGALWCLALFFSFLAVAFALVIHAQRNPRKNPFESPFFQAEFLQMSPTQQALFLQQNMQMPGCCGSSGVSVYDTPYYAFLRFAWGFVGCVVFVWIAVLLVPFFTFIPYFIDHTNGELRAFWEGYYTKYLPTILCVGAYLAWPIVSHVLEAIVWVVGIIPWFIIRSFLKPGIERFRPEMNLSELPGYIRADMFFMDCQDIKRCGFSRLQWMLLTDTHTPFMDCCEDPLLIRDPDTMQSMVRGPAAMMMAQAAAAAAAAGGAHPGDAPPAADTGRTTQAGLPMQETGGDGREGTTKHRHRSGRRSGEGEGSEQASPSLGHRRHERRGGKEGESRSRHHRSGRSENNVAGSPQNERSEEGESPREESRQRRRHRGHRESGGESSAHRHHRSGSGRRSPGSGRREESGSRQKSKEPEEVSQSFSKSNEQLEALMKI